MGTANSRPAVVKPRRRVSIRGGGSLVDLLLEGKHGQVMSKARVEANKEVCVKLDDDQERWVLPLHIACALPNVPMSVIQSLLMAYPQAVMRHTTMSKTGGKQKGEQDTARSRELSAGSIEEASDMSVEHAWGVGWLPIHVAAYYGASLEIVELLLRESPGSIYCKTTQGMLPLHVACTAIDSSHHLIETFVEAFPLSICISTMDGSTARDLAVIEGNCESPDILQLLTPSTPSETRSRHIQNRPIHNIPSPKHRSFLKKIVSTGRLEADRETPLFTAVSKRQWKDCLEILARKPKDALVWTLSPDPKDPPCHVLPLHMALRRNAPYKVVKTLLDANLNALYRREYYGMLALHIACDLGLDMNIVKLLCEAYPDAARQKDLGGMTPLHVACASKCDEAVITYLLSKHPKAIHIEDGNGRLAQDYCEDSKEFDRGDAFWGAKKIEMNRLALFICQKKWDEALKRLKSSPEEATQWTIHPLIQLRYLPLHYACIVKAPIDLVRALLAANAAAASTECQEYDMLPLHLACQHGANPNVVFALLEAHKDAAAKPDAYELLPLHLACTQGACAAVVESLVASNPEAIRAMDRNGNTPRVYAEAVVHPHSKRIMSLLDESTTSES